MAAQTTVSTDPAVAFAGMQGDSGNNRVRSYVNEEASAEMAFGVMLKQGTADNDALLLAVQTDRMIGVLVHSHAYNKDNELGTTGVKPNVSIGVLTHGWVWVEVTEAVTPASAVKVDEAGGTFGDTATANETVDISPFARYLTSAGANEFALLELDMTGYVDRTLDT